MNTAIRRAIAAAALGLGTLSVAAQPIDFEDGNPFISRFGPRSVTSHLRIDIVPESFTNPNQIRVFNPWSIGRGRFVLPLIGRTATAQPRRDRVEGRVELSPQSWATRYEVLDGFPYEAEFAEFNVVNGRVAGNLGLEIRVPMRIAETKLDEPRARAVEWPKEWPEEAASSLVTQFGVDLGQRDKTAVQNLVKNWTGGQPPTNVKPYELAKYFFSRVVREYQPTGIIMGAVQRPQPFDLGNGINNIRTPRTFNGFFRQGFPVQGAAQTIRSRNGSELDIAGLYAATLRAVGIPARIVIGLRMPGSNFDTIEQVSNGVRGTAIGMMVEFYLYDENTKQGGWIPTDPFLRREGFGNGEHPINQPWQFFGTHDDADFFVPFAHHLHPPLEVLTYGLPGTWGFTLAPAIPANATQNIIFDAYESVVTIDD
ncbi:MAG: transglutaminase domain-containing protein [Planctomycetota bacterium]